LMPTLTAMVTEAPVEMNTEIYALG
jgi:hypothetical protein